MNTRWLLAGSMALLVAAGARVASAGNWTDSVTLYGDIRYRHESIQEEAKADRDRQRVRARLGLKAVLDENWGMDFRLATGGTDPVSTNQTLGDYFTTKSIGLDKAALIYKPLPDNLILTAGKMSNPFEDVGGTGMIFDGDLTPEGIGGNAKIDLGGLNLFVNGGGFWVVEQSSTIDSMLYGAQIGLSGKLSDIKVMVGGSYYNYPLIQGQKVFVDTSNSFGNTYRTLGTSKYYDTTYQLAEGFLEVGFAVANLPMGVFGKFVTNGGASENNQGYNFGLVVNKAKAPGSWEVAYNYRELQKDAVVGAFCDSDFIGGGTDGSGHLIAAAYAVTDKVKTKATYLIDQKKLEDGHAYKRLQIDVEMKY